jgi:hypothetical protein
MRPVPGAWHWRLILSIILFIKEDAVILTLDKQRRLGNRIRENAINKVDT